MGWSDQLSHLRDTVMAGFREGSETDPNGGTNLYETADEQTQLLVRVIFHAPDTLIESEGGITEVSGQEPQAWVILEDLAPVIPQEGDHVTIWNPKRQENIRYRVAGVPDEPGGRGFYRLPLYEEPLE